MPFSPTAFPGLLVFEPLVHGDDRGYFFESYNEQVFADAGINLRFVQDNQARSGYGVVRGLHFQREPYAQSKLVRVLEGSILDVVLDLRQGSPAEGKVFILELSAANKKQLLVPAGFAHGYAVLSETAEVLYKCDKFYHKESEGGVAYNDPDLQIDWGLPSADMILSSKDLRHPPYRDCRHGFTFKG